MSRYDVAHATTLKSETVVRADFNLNEIVGVISRPGEPIYYQAPSDPAAHLQYVDAEGRVLPVDPNTLQIMTNATGHVVDKDGALVPVYEFATKTSYEQVHEDDVRVAVVGRDIIATDENDEDVYVSPDGDIIPVGDDGLPSTVLVEGEVWVLDAAGIPVAPLDRVIPLGSYRKPIQARNVPYTKGGQRIEAQEPLFDDIFPIESIIEGDRPRKRGALKAWASDDTSAVATHTDTADYDQGRFYTASPDSKYKYWTSNDTAESAGTLGARLPESFNNSWAPIFGTNVVVTTGQVSADFKYPGIILDNFNRQLPALQKYVSLEPGTSYTMSFTGVAQEGVYIDVNLVWDKPSERGSFNKVKTIKSIYLPTNTPVTETVTFVSDHSAVDHMIQFNIRRTRLSLNPRISFSALDINKTVFAIEDSGPRVTYDRPLPANKIVVGVDYTVDERHADSASNMPVDSVIRAFVDRGDGVFTWETIATNPRPNNDGMIELFYDGTDWTNKDVFTEESVKVMGVHYIVWGMNVPSARLNIMEISAHLRLDFSDRLISYNAQSEVSDDSFVLPFGTVSSNVGSIVLSNTDGIFNEDNMFLLDLERVVDGDFVFSDIINPLYGLLNGGATWTIDTCVYDVDYPPTEKEWIRMLTMKGNIPEVDDKMQANISLKDSSSILQRRKPAPLFFANHTGMSVMQVIYILLDSVGFTSVEFDDNHLQTAPNMNYFWTDPERTVWEMLEELCRATQVTAYFDEFDNLRLKSLRGLYEDALSTPPKAVLTTDDVGDMKSNIKQINEGEMLQTNRVELEYRELKPGEISDSGVAKMEVVWEPEGDVVLRAQPLVRRLVDYVEPIQYMWFPSGTTETWPFEGMVNIEGELIKYRGKRYEYYMANGKPVTTMVYDETRRKMLDRINPELSHKNKYDGGLKIAERGAEGTLVRSHDIALKPEYLRRFRNPAGVTSTNNSIAAVSQSKLVFKPIKAADSKSYNVVARGNMVSYPPRFLGTRMNITGGSSTAGICFGLNNNNMDGIFVEFWPTEWVEKQNRVRNEMIIYVRKNGITNRVGSNMGTVFALSKNKFYDIDVIMTENTLAGIKYEFSKFEGIALRSGSRGANVKVLQRALNTLWREKLVVDGVFGNKTREAVKRMQSKNGITSNGVMNTASWRAMGSYSVDSTKISVHVLVDGMHTTYLEIPKADLPYSWDGGLYGVFTRSQTNAEFEYLYGFRGSEELVNDGDNGLISKVTGSYFSDQINNGWFYNRKYRHIIRGAGKILRNSINDQFFFDDWGPWAHEVRDFNVKFSDQNRPAEYSNLYFSNEEGALEVEYDHDPLGAKFRLANTSRHDAILQGEDPWTFGVDDSIDQRMMIYGRVLQDDAGKSISIEDKNSTRSIGIHELSISTDWIQNKEAANKLGSHIVEAMSMPVKTYSIDLFGNPYLKVGDITVVNAPAQGTVSGETPESIDAANRYVVTSVDHDNDGSHATSVTVRQLIDKGGYRYVQLSDVLKRNNNNMLRNQYLDEFDMELSGGSRTLTPKDVEPTSGNTALHFRPEGPSGGNMSVRGTTVSTPSNYKTVGFVPSNILLLSGGMSRPAHTIGEYYLWTVEVTAQTDCAVELAIEGYNSSGFVKTLASTRVRLKSGVKKRITLTGQYLEDGTVPELSPRMYLMKYDLTAATQNQRVSVHDMFYRSSNSQDHIWPDYGYATLRRP